jgi:hypothetical protein
MNEQPAPGAGGWPPDKGGVSRSKTRKALRVAAGVAVVVVMAATARDLARGSSQPMTRGGQDLTPSPTAPSQSRDPSAALLADLIVTDADVDPALTVVGMQGGNGLSQPTLDLCEGTHASESMRTARLQVLAVDAQGQAALSTEAVLYSSGAGTAAAFSELKATAASCRDGRTRFGPAPDSDWPQVPSVERLAFAFDTVDSSGETDHSVAVFLRRGRALLGVYFSHADAPTAVVDGKTALGEIVNIFAGRLAKLPVAAISTTA